MSLPASEPPAGRAPESREAPKEPIQVEGAEVLERVRALNAEGRHVIFAPNHLTPTPGSRHAQFDMPDDFGMLKKAMTGHGVSVVPVMRNDLNMATQGSTLKTLAYRMHKKIFGVVGKAVTGGVTVSMNTAEPAQAVASNVGAVRGIIETVKTKNNVALYPYGNWYESGQQQFDDETAFGPDAGFVKMPDPRQDPEGFTRWRNSLKKGFISTARQAKAAIVPVYVERNDGRWLIRFGQPIEPPASRDAEIDTAKRYIGEMRRLKAGEPGPATAA